MQYIIIYYQSIPFVATRDSNVVDDDLDLDLELEGSHRDKGSNLSAYFNIM